MTDKEAMRLALEALETLMIERESIYEKAITALKERLADPMREVQRLGQEIEQEPVAHCKVRPLRGDESFPKVEIDWVNHPIPGPLYTSPPQRTEQEPVSDEIASIIACRDMLDAQPVPEFDRVIWPERTWVGLTDDEIALINADYPHPQGFARAIEAKLSEKNT
jgi:hypothetical protein